MAEVRETISIGSKADTRGFKKAESAAAKLSRSLKNLAGAFGVAYSTAQVVNFGKASVRAFAEMSAEQDRLTRLMKIGTGASASQIQALNSQSKALENLGVVSQGNITQVQSQLATFNLQASTIAKLTPSILDYVTAEKGATASTEEFKQMTNGLAQALNGNFASLTRVGFVIDQTTKDIIKNGNETERTAAIVRVLDSTYKGFNKSLRDTPIGQMQLLANASENARETIGEGLVDALALLGGSGTKDIEKATGAMNDFSLAIADVIRGQAVVAAQVGGAGGGSVGTFGSIVKTYFKEVLGIQALQDLGAATRPRPRAGRYFSGGSQQTLFDKSANDAAKREKERLALAKKQLDATKKLTEEQKKQAILKKAGTLFDMEQIQLVAALKGQLSDEERKRVELQFALITGNTSEAQKLTYELAKSQGLGEKLATFLSSLDFKNNPFASWEAYLDRLLKKAQEGAKAAAEAGAGGGGGGGTPAIPPMTPEDRTRLLAPVNPKGTSTIGEYIRQLDLAGTATLPTFESVGSGQGGSVMENYRLNQIELKITGEGDVTNAIAKGLQNQSLSTGNSTTINRRSVAGL